MPADDIVAKKIPVMGVVVMAGQAPAFGPENIVPVVNRLADQFDQLGIGELVRERARSNLELAEQLRHARRQRTLRRARLMERKAEHRMIQAWRRAAELRARIESPDG